MAAPRLTDREALTISRQVMTIDFTCQKCEASFELDAQDLTDGTEKLVCPHCDAKAPANMVDDFTGAVTELKTQVAALAKKFAVNLSVETEDLEDELDEDEEKDEEGEEDDDELDFEDDDLEEDDEDVEDEDKDKEDR
jgi:DNA-directed RNA polymerase subunit RPC12/RpoP